MKPETFMLHGHEVAVDGRNLDMRLFWMLVKSMVESPAQSVSECLNSGYALQSVYMCPAIQDLDEYLTRHCTVMGAMVVGDCAREALARLDEDLGDFTFITSTLPEYEREDRYNLALPVVDDCEYLADMLWRQQFRHEWLDARIEES